MVIMKVCTSYCWFKTDDGVQIIFVARFCVMNLAPIMDWLSSIIYMYEPNVSQSDGSSLFICYNCN